MGAKNSYMSMWKKVEKPGLQGSLYLNPLTQSDIDLLVISLDNYDDTKAFTPRVTQGQAVPKVRKSKGEQLSRQIDL